MRARSFPSPASHMTYRLLMLRFSAPSARAVLLCRATCSWRNVRLPPLPYVLLCYTCCTTPSCRTVYRPNVTPYHCATCWTVYHPCRTIVPHMLYCVPPMPYHCATHAVPCITHAVPLCHPCCTVYHPCRTIVPHMLYRVPPMPCALAGQ